MSAFFERNVRVCYGKNGLPHAKLQKQKALNYARIFIEKYRFFAIKSVTPAPIALRFIYVRHQCALKYAGAR